MHSNLIGTIERALSSKVGVLKAEVSLTMNTAKVDVGDSALSSETLVGIIEDMGFEASPLDTDAGEEAAINQIIRN